MNFFVELHISPNLHISYQKYSDDNTWYPSKFCPLILSPIVKNQHFAFVSVYEFDNLAYKHRSYRCGLYFRGGLIREGRLFETRCTVHSFKAISSFQRRTKITGLYLSHIGKKSLEYPPPPLIINPSDKDTLKKSF